LKAQVSNGGQGTGELSQTPPQTPEDVVRTLLLVAPEAGKPPPEIIGAALKAAKIPITDSALMKALMEAAGPGAKKPPADIVARARHAAGVYTHDAEKSAAPEPSDTGYVAHKTIQVPKGNGSSHTAVTFNNGIAMMSDKPAKANRILDAMQAGIRLGPATEPEPRQSSGLGPPGAEGFQLPETPEDVVKTLLTLIPDAGAPPPEVVAQAMAASGVPCTEANLRKALKLANGREPLREELMVAEASAQAYKPGAAKREEEANAAEKGSMSSSSKMPRSPKKVMPQPTDERTPEEVVKVLCSAAPGLGQPPPTVVGMALRQAGVQASEETVKRALKAAGDPNPSSKDIRTAMAAAQDLE